jgi:hypothetical protein
MTNGRGSRFIYKLLPAPLFFGTHLHCFMSFTCFGLHCKGVSRDSGRAEITERDKSQTINISLTIRGLISHFNVHISGCDIRLSCRNFYRLLILANSFPLLNVRDYISEPYKTSDKIISSSELFV